VVVALLVSVAGTTPARADDNLSSEKAKLEQVRSDRAAVAAKIDALQASDAETKQALDALDEDVRGQQALYDNAKRKADDADQLLRQAQQDLVDAESQVQRLARQAHDAAIQAYVQPPEDDVAAALTGDPTDAVVRKALAGLTSRQATEVLDQYQSARDDLAYKRTVADRAAKKATDRRDTANARLQKLQTSLQRQRTAVASIEDQLDSALVESANLSGLDATLSAQLASKQAELAARLAAAHLLSGGDNGGIGAGRDVGSITVVNVGGIEVNADIAPQVAQLLQAALGDGIVLGGGGYRSPEAQIAVRRANCGSSSYAIWQMPPSTCHPPAARPGKSMHERGLAIDFTCSGALIVSHSSPCFQWLAANAWKYGLQNYAREPWHWSTNGR
jgi:hypothetical protein